MMTTCNIFRYKVQTSNYLGPLRLVSSVVCNMDSRDVNYSSSPFLKTIFLAFIKQICFSAPQINNFWTPIPIFLLLCALFAIVGIGYTNPSADNASTLEGSIIALITNSHQCARTHIRITYYTFPIIFLTKSSYCNSWLLPAHNQIWMMLCHASRP